MMVESRLTSLFLNRNFFLPVNLALTSVQQLQKDLLIKLPGAVLIGIGQGGTTGSGDSQMFQFALTASQTAGNFSEGMGSAQLAEEHGHKLAPAGESPGMTFGFGFFDSLLKFDSEKRVVRVG